MYLFQFMFPTERRVRSPLSDPSDSCHCRSYSRRVIFCRWKKTARVGEGLQLFFYAPTPHRPFFSLERAVWHKNENWNSQFCFFLDYVLMCTLYDEELLLSFSHLGICTSAPASNIHSWQSFIRATTNLPSCWSPCKLPCPRFWA